MTTFGGGVQFSAPRITRQTLLALLLLTLVLVAPPQRTWAAQDAQPAAPSETAPPYTQHNPSQLQQLVAPIALYPDSLVAQILAASTFPEQVVEADRFLQAHPDLKNDAMAKSVDQQSWDPSVKALTVFPAVLGNMDKNLSWTSSLGDAFYNQQADVMDAVQAMRVRAKNAGSLKDTPQQKVTTQDSTIVVEPTDPEIVYVPQYDPWLTYGTEIMAWPGWYPYPGIWYDGPFLAFGDGFGIGYYGGYGWGWPRWGFNWRDRSVTHDRHRYYSRSTTFYNRSSYYRGGGGRGGAQGGTGAPLARFNAATGPATGRTSVYNHPGATTRPFNGNALAARGYAAPRGQTGVRSSAFSGDEQGGQTRHFSSRGSSSLRGGSRGGGGASHGGGGGASHGGGGGHR